MLHKTTNFRFSSFDFSIPLVFLILFVSLMYRFWADFEDECSKLSIPLYVLPPATPKYNGGVERANRILREEFYSNPRLLADSIGAMRLELQKMLKKYNEYRPHAGLNGITPVEYIRNYSEHTSLSQSI